jgi:hypothetical protein
MYLCREREKVFWSHYGIGLKPCIKLDYCMYTLRLITSCNHRILFMRLCNED